VIAPTTLSVEGGMIIALLGPSGSGKSTLLRMLSGLATPSAGEVLWHGQHLLGASPNAAIAFQSFALFPWLTVVQNVEVPLLARGMEHRERHRRAIRMLHAVGLKGFETAYPKEVSGGMKQRVGFARELAVEPEVLFMDEPFSALDVLTAENLRGELMQLWIGKKIPTTFFGDSQHRGSRASRRPHHRSGEESRQDPCGFPRSNAAATRSERGRIPLVYGLHL
jgi:NitT/TauT family transport system ATP-binding protein